MWELKLPVGEFNYYPSMIIDEYGNIYITERDSDKVFIVTEDGTRHTERFCKVRTDFIM